jgi:hypothetical protein
MYDYEMDLEHSICAYWIGKYEECAQISLKLLSKPNLPSNIRECAENNLAHANRKLIALFLSQKQ